MPPKISNAKRRMKIGIITLIPHSNIGGTLQAWVLQTALDSVKPHPKRDAFCEMLRNGCSVKQASDKLLKKPLHVSVLRFAKHLITQVSRRIK